MSQTKAISLQFSHQNNPARGPSDCHLLAPVFAQNPPKITPPRPPGVNSFSSISRRKLVIVQAEGWMGTNCSV